MFSDKVVATVVLQRVLILGHERLQNRSLDFCQLFILKYYQFFLKLIGADDILKFNLVSFA